MLRPFLTPLAPTITPIVIRRFSACAANLNGQTTLGAGLDGSCATLLLPPTTGQQIEVTKGVVRKKYTSRRMLDNDDAALDPVLAKAKRALWRLSSLPDDIADPCNEGEVLRWYEGKQAAKANRRAERQKEKEAVARRKIIRLGRLALRQLELGSLRPRELVAKAPKLESLLEPSAMPSPNAEDQEIYRWYDRVCTALSSDAAVDDEHTNKKRRRKRRVEAVEEGSLEALASPG
ncbi:hypothetical protein FOZ63_003377 [Perkinsus olseni]|uniref:Uncharacterized protein n=1 Tax=Perkinsus olseni TaxID=32597 RepID=A0A7J6RAK1_PEROL|nr:hypothetical protein FOZ62_010603 [Perkinsus olseni]KAF4756294.1 hypothetical protein FOZ63_003377 [Perkinsus olseni]